MARLRLAIIIGSMRPNRLAARAAQWIEAISMRQDDFDAPELIELTKASPECAIRPLSLPPSPPRNIRACRRGDE